MGHASRIHGHRDQRERPEIMNTAVFGNIVGVIREYILMHPLAFDLGFLDPPEAPATSAKNAIVKAYSRITELCNMHGVTFDHHWCWVVAWRHALSLASVREIANGDTELVVNTFHPRSHKALRAIFEHGLDRYMRWYPWRWFRDLVLIGSGGFSAVYVASVTLPYDGLEGSQVFGDHPRKVVLKVVDEKILNEIVVQSKALLTLLYHGLTVCESTGDLLMIGTFAEKGNLECHIDRPADGCSDLTRQVSIVTQLAFHLASLHDEVGMCHRNIHPGNILYENDECFLVDYRFSTSSSESSAITRQSKAHYGRLPYIAPEVREGIYTEKSDVYSLGVIMWQLIACIRFPSPEVLSDAPEVYTIERVPGVPEWYQDVMTACLEPRPENRPDAEELGQEWARYVTRRRDKCKLHWQRWTSSAEKDAGHPLDTSATHPDNDPTIAAPRVFALHEIPPAESLITLPLCHQPRDNEAHSNKFF